MTGKFIQPRPAKDAQRPFVFAQADGGHTLAMAENGGRPTGTIDFANGIPIYRIKGAVA